LRSSTGPTGTVSNHPWMSALVASVTRAVIRSAVACTRDAMLGGSPAMSSVDHGLASTGPTATTPLSTPILTVTGVPKRASQSAARASTASSTASDARTARRASSSWATG
jgi:hypothetical protein